MVEPIPFNRHCLGDVEGRFFAEASASRHIAGDGPFARKVETLLSEQLGVGRVLLTTSCTHALEMSGLLLGLRPGDEVIVPSFTFTSTALAFHMCGARLVFADIRPDTLNIDESRLEALVTKRTRAIVIVHYVGVACEIEPILRIAERHSLMLIEDNAHGLYGKYKGRSLGTFGALATLSFHETKNISCGEGGALLINDPALVELAEIIREKGTNRSHFARGEVHRYSWVDKGSSYVLSDLLAAVLYGQVSRSDEIQQKRRYVWRYYYASLLGWAAENGVRLPIVPAHCEQAYHLFYILLPSAAARDVPHPVFWTQDSVMRPVAWSWLRPSSPAWFGRGFGSRSCRAASARCSARNKP